MSPPTTVKRRSQKQYPKFHTTSRRSRSPQVLSTTSMSLYPQTQAYGQMVYSAPQGYGQPAVPTYYQPPPPPQPPYYADPTHFGRDYMARLAELTVNSRPIIQNLSMIAQEYQRYGDIVVQCIENHIRRVSHPFCFPSSLIPLVGSQHTASRGTVFLLCSSCHVCSVPRSGLRKETWMGLSGFMG